MNIEYLRLALDIVASGKDPNEIIDIARLLQGNHPRHGVDLLTFLETSSVATHWGLKSFRIKAHHREWIAALQDNKKNVIVASRQMGLTTFFSLYALRLATSEKRRILVVGSNNEILKNMREIIVLGSAEKKAYCIRRDTDKRVRLGFDHSTIEFVHEMNALEGGCPLYTDIILMDASSYSHSRSEALDKKLAGQSGARITFAACGGEPKGIFYNKVKSPEWFLTKTIDYDEKSRSMMSEDDFRREYLGEFIHRRS